MIKKDTFEVILLLGGNQGDRVKTLSAAVNMICDQIGSVVVTSGLYSSPAWGFDSENDFLNQAVKVKTSLGPRQLLKRILEIEIRLGRERQGSGYTDRPIDIDILCWEEKIFWTASLQVPHIKLHERAFALIPLQEICPEWRHPLLEMNPKEMLAELGDDASEVRSLEELHD